jgi:hypothetical protein
LDMETHLITHKKTSNQKPTGFPCDNCSEESESVLEYKCDRCEYSSLAIEELWKHKMFAHQAYEAIKT